MIVNKQLEFLACGKKNDGAEWEKWEETTIERMGKEWGSRRFPAENRGGAKELLQKDDFLERGVGGGGGVEEVDAAGESGWRSVVQSRAVQSAVMNHIYFAT